MKYEKIDNRWPEPTKQQFPTMSIRNQKYKGNWFEDMHWWWRHLPEHMKYQDKKHNQIL